MLLIRQSFDTTLYQSQQKNEDLKGKSESNVVIALWLSLCCQSEVYDDPSSVQPPQFPYQQTPQVFLFSRPATEHLDRDTATTLAWRLRGLALLVLVHRYTSWVGLCFDVIFLSSKTFRIMV